MNDWNEKREVKKGSIGEQKMWDILKKTKLIPYRPVYDGAHPLDIFCVSLDMENIGIADSKAKARRTKYKDTGIDLKHYNKYTELQNKYNLENIVLYFTDESYGLLYANKINELEKQRKYNGIEYPWDHGLQRYWPISAMIPLTKLNEEEIEILKRLRKSRFEYPKDNDPEHDFLFEPLKIFDIEIPFIELRKKNVWEHDIFDLEK